LDWFRIKSNRSYSILSKILIIRTALEITASPLSVFDAVGGATAIASVLVFLMSSSASCC